MTDAGHYWFEDDNVSMPFKEQPTFPIDGEHTPKDTIDQGTAGEVILGNYRIIAWHDYTGDSRPGSNSALVGLGYESRDEMLIAAAVKFPSIMKRQKGPLKFVEES